MNDTKFNYPVLKNGAKMSRFSTHEILDEMDAEAAKRKWTTEPPTKPGWYWARTVGDKTKTLNVVQVVLGDFYRKAGSLEVLTSGWDKPEQLSDFDLWAGPIEAPPLPEGKV